jgi:hypothetical protein
MARKPHIVATATERAALAGEPDRRPIDAPPAATITFAVPCPDCDWCSGLVALLGVDGVPSVAVAYDADLLADQPDSVTRMVVGVDLKQTGFLGLAQRPGEVTVGLPPHPVCAALNLAWQSGLEAVEIRGASDGLIDRLQPFLAALGEKLRVSFTTDAELGV